VLKGTFQASAQKVGVSKKRRNCGIRLCGFRNSRTGGQEDQHYVPRHSLAHGANHSKENEDSYPPESSALENFGGRDLGAEEPPSGRIKWIAGD